MALKTGGQGNATSSGGITRFIRFVFDRGAAKRVEQEAQQSARKVADPYAAAGKKMGNDMLSGILPGFSKMERAAKATAQNIKKPFDWLGRELKETFGGRLQQALSLGAIAYGIKTVTRAATDLVSALTGLASISEAFGASQKDAQEAAQALAVDGLMTVTDAATGLKNLLASGFSLPEAVQLMHAFKDSAAFGRQSALSFGQAIASATEGIKNGNSILVDNAGITKNLSIILREAGYAETDLMKATTDAGVRMALFNGILKEAQPMLGDAATYANSAAGEIARMQAETEKAQASIGLKLLPVTGKLATGFNQYVVPAIKFFIAIVETAGNTAGWYWDVLSQGALRIDLFSARFRRSVLDLGLTAVQVARDVPLVGAILGWTGADDKLESALNRQLAVTDQYIGRLKKRVQSLGDIYRDRRAVQDDIWSDASDRGAGFTAEVGPKPRVNRTPVTPPPKEETEAQRRARLRREAAAAARAAKQAARDAEKAQKEADEDFVRRAQREERFRTELAGGSFSTRDAGGGPKVRERSSAKDIADSFNHQQERMREQVTQTYDLWMDRNAEIENAVQSMASSVVGAWASAFEQIGQEGADLGSFMETLGRGMGGALLGGLAQLASGKVAENIARAFEQFALAASYASTPGLQLFAPGAAAAGKGFLLAAAKWGLLGGVAGAASSAVGGGGGLQRGGYGDVHRGGGLYGKDAADRTQPHNITYVYVTPFDPNNPVQTRQIGKAMDLHVQLSGKPEWVPQ